MRYRFDSFTLDTDRGVLEDGTRDVAMEPRAFSLVTHLVMNSDRVVSRDEIVERIWDGRIVSDAAIATVVKTARKAIGDDGTAQKYLRTIRGRGFRFVGRVETIPAGRVADPGHPGPSEDALPSSRPSIAILPFRLVGHSDNHGVIADAIPAELISGLSRLRWLKVVSRGSSFRFRQADPDLTAVRHALGVNYCLSGLAEIYGSSLEVAVELSDTRSGAVVWSEHFPGRVDDVHETRNTIAAHVISALELHIPLNEAGRARLSPPENLDAWSIYHLGLQHMYRFNRADNIAADAHFARAIQLAPGFARAFAARSFTSFQSAFLGYGPDRRADVENARVFAERCLELDPVDPFGNFTLGRAFWLKGEPDAGVPWLDRAVGLSPSFAQGHYAHGWADVMAGRHREALDRVGTAIALSPLDPFLYAMHATRGLAHLHRGDFEKAAHWAEKGAREPGAHFLIGAIAALTHAFKGDGQKAAYWANSVLTRRPDASVEMFFTAFPFEDPAIRRPISDALVSLGLKSD